MTKIIAITNQKGGCGKTTTSIQLADMLTNVYNKEVLLIDLDPQHTLTNQMLVEVEGNKTSYEFIVMNTEARIALSENMDFIPAGNSLTNMKNFNTPDAPEMLKKALKKYEGQYDYIIFDCPPGIAELTHNAYAAAESLIIPVTPGTYSIEGIAQLKGQVDMIKKYYNPNLKVEGILMLNVDNGTNAKKALISLSQKCSEILNTKCFTQIIHHSTVINDAQEASKPLREFNKNCTATKAYLEFVKEVIGEYNEL